MPKLLLLPGDGIGPEITDEVRRVAERITNDLTVDERPFGGASLDAHGSPLTEETLATAKAADAVLMGAVGGAVGASPWEKVPRNLRPEAGLLGLRSGMQVFANLRPAICYGPLADASTLKREVVEGLDLMIVRELTGGVYFGQPRGVDDLPDGQRRAVDTQVYTTHEIERVSRVAFELARGRRNKVTSAEKANVMETGAFWREVVTALHAREYPDVTLEHMLADNAAMQLVKNPRQFDVLVTDNLFGDILSDEAAQLTGSLGMLPSAALGEPGKPGLYEPIHGSAPDIAGQGVANPLAAILSFEMALRWSLARPDLADRLGAAVKAALDGGARTRDLGGQLSTRQMGDAVLAGL
ncbi:MAG TPA: 3-isopropylmalate dehydrogenase [Caulobacteraceae bacterium]|jgi:3-isopropylmalate dehydrogenase|nr:3-isopropylmalate dehydrogenase [Caulobacteraceae bacterium]